MYEIKDLEWNGFTDGYCRSGDLWTASISFYQIVKRSDGFRVFFSDGHYPDPIERRIKTLDEAKAKANAHWRGILEPFLRGIK